MGAERAQSSVRRCRRFALATAAAVVLGLGLASPAGAHPLGNFTVNTSAALRIRPDEVLVDYVVDEAEIPTVQSRSDIDDDGDGDLSAQEKKRYAAETCDDLASRIALEVGSAPVPLASTTAELTFPPGQAGLDTLRLRCQLIGSGVDISSPTTVRLKDGNFDGRLGWREILALGDRTTITESDVGGRSTSDRLTAYPKDQIKSPLDQRSASITVKPGGAAAPAPEGGTGAGSATPLPGSDRLNELLGERNFTLPFALFALSVAFILGGFHAVAPGHGKTVMAAYLVGQRGARRQALILGATVAFTHTGGVMALALVISNSSIAPERFYPILGTVSGLLVVGIGAVLLRRALQFRRIFPTLAPGTSHHHHHGIGGHTHDLADHGTDSPDHTHGHDGHSHDHDHHDSHDHAGHSHDHAHDDRPEVATVATVATIAAPATTSAAVPSPTSTDTSHTNASARSTDDQADPATPLAAAPPIELRSMMAMGFAGGMVPSPSALVVLLGSIAIGRAWFGFALIIAYGAGLAAVLVGAGLLIERLRHLVEPFLARRRSSRLAGLAVNLPVITAVLVVLGGVYLVARVLLRA